MDGHPGRAVDLERIDAELDRVAAWASTIGVSVSLDRDDDGAIFLSDLARDRADPSTRGNGGAVMTALCDLADRHGVAFETSHMSDEPGLGTYYTRFGFSVDGEPGPITNMRRTPARAQAA